MRNKYHNQKSGGFDSRKEERRFMELLMMQRAGHISELQTQVKYELIPSQYESYERYGKDGKRLKDGQKLVERGVSYVADFVYKDSTGKTVVEDTKGVKTKDYILKRKLML